MGEQNQIPLRAAMIFHARALLSTVLPSMVNVDVLKDLENIIPPSGIINVSNADVYATLSLDGMAKAKLYCKVAMAFWLAADSEVKRIKALKIFEAAETMTTQDDKGKVKKPTQDEKEAFVDSNPDVISAKDIRNSWQVLSEYFEASLFEMKSRHMWFKSLAERDLSTGDTPEEA